MKKGKEKSNFSLKLFGNNVNGLAKKIELLEHLIVTGNPSVIFFQETKSTRSGRIKTQHSKNYTWYELHSSKSSEKEAKEVV